MYIYPSRCRISGASWKPKRLRKGAIIVIEQNMPGGPEPAESASSEVPTPSMTRRASRHLQAVKGGKKKRLSATSASLPALNGKRPATTPLPTTNGQRPPTSPLPSARSARPVSSPLSAPISLERAYELLSERVAASESVTQQEGALIVRMPQEEIGQRVYLQSQATWQDHPYRPQYEAEVYRRAIQGHSLTAVVFRHIPSSEYFAWTGRQVPIELQILPGKATVLDFTLAMSTPFAAPPDPVASEIEKQPEKLAMGGILLGLALLGGITGAVLGLLVGYPLPGAIVGALAFSISGLLRITGNRATSAE
jgi:hypothetical protein